ERFWSHGFQGIGIDEIARASGITGPGIYRHFDSKDELLHTLLIRASDRLAKGVGHALARASDASEALEGLIQSYLELSLDAPDLLAVYWTQNRSLPRDRRAVIVRERRAFIK